VKERSTEQCLNAVESEVFLRTIGKLYFPTSYKVCRDRYKSLLESAIEKFSPQKLVVLSVPGRTELGGNHTDHNRGKVLAAGICLDAVGAFEKAKSNVVSLFSEGYKNPFVVNLSCLEPVKAEEGSTEALIKGVAATLRRRGFKIGGWKGYVKSDVLPGLGLSSSAVIELLIGGVFNYLFNNGNIPRMELALAGKYAENHYFGKPCGLMDQIACAEGGIVAIDFGRSSSLKGNTQGYPLIEKLKLTFTDYGYQLVVIDTGASHVDLGREYASIPSDMKAVASALGVEFLGNTTREQLLKNVSLLRVKAGDRAILRALHFFKENLRVEDQVNALKRKDIKSFLALVKESGDSSWKLLQNCYLRGDIPKVDFTEKPVPTASANSKSCEPHSSFTNSAEWGGAPFAHSPLIVPPITSHKSSEEWGVALGIVLTEEFTEKGGVARVHGGGFTGTVQAYIPLELEEEYRRKMEGVFGEGSVTPLFIREEGITRVL